MINMASPFYTRKIFAPPEVFENSQARLMPYFLTYIIDSKFRKSVKLKYWIRKQVNETFESVLETGKKIKDYKDPDKQAFAVFQWVRKNISYIWDSKSVYKRLEYWQTAEETVKEKVGDCEDGAILIYILCRLKGIPANRLYITASNVNGGGGHAFCLYKPSNYPFDYVILDWCYDYDYKEIHHRNVFTILGNTIRAWKRTSTTTFKEVETNYYNLWFLFNEENSWKKIRVKKFEQR